MQVIIFINIFINLPNKKTAWLYSNEQKQNGSPKYLCIVVKSERHSLELLTASKHSHFLNQSVGFSIVYPFASCACLLLFCFLFFVFFSFKNITCTQLIYICFTFLSHLFASFLFLSIFCIVSQSCRDLILSYWARQHCASVAICLCFRLFDFEFIFVVLF